MLQLILWKENNVVIICTLTISIENIVFEVFSVLFNFHFNIQEYPMIHTQKNIDSKQSYLNILFWITPKWRESERDFRVKCIQDICQYDMAFNIVWMWSAYNWCPPHQKKKFFANYILSLSYMRVFCIVYDIMSSHCFFIHAIISIATTKKNAVSFPSGKKNG